MHATLAPGAPPAAAVTRLALVPLLAPCATTPKPAHAVLLEALSARVQSEMAPTLSACRATSQLGPTLRAASLRLGRILDLVREAEALGAKVLMAAAVDADARGICLSLHYSFFAARAKFVLHLLLASEDPSDPIQWQLAQADTMQQPAAAPMPGCTALSTAQEPIMRTVGAIVEANARGFGRLTAIHTALTAAFCPA